MKRLSTPYARKLERGDTITVVRLAGRRVGVSPRGSTKNLIARNGFTLIELVISITVLTILTLGVIPLMKLSVKRQKEQELHETLRTIRAAIDQFHREALAYNCNLPAGQPQPLPVDPRIKVAISDCNIYGVDNLDRYPPDLETLVTGVNVISTQSMGGRGQQGVDATKVGDLSTKKKVYLRSLPIDPMTGKADWDMRSCYDPADSDSWGGENVFDVRSKSKDTALNGEKYRDW